MRDLIHFPRQPRNPEYPHGWQLRWAYNDEIETWNFRVAHVVELFGLPGDRFVTEVTTHSMNFYFRNEQDALLFKLCHGQAELVQD